MHHLVLLAQAVGTAGDAPLVVSWSIPVLSIAALAGGYAFLIRSLTARVERLEIRLDSHSDLPGHPVTVAKLEAMAQGYAEMLGTMRQLATKVDAVQETLASVVGELRASRDRNS